MSLFKRGNVWWYSFFFAGQLVRESSKSTSKTIAKSAEQERRRELEAGYNNVKEVRQNRIRTVAEIIVEYLVGYGVALIDQRTPIDSALTTRPIAGIHWTADTAFVHHNDADHLALPLVIRFAQEMRGSMSGKKPPLKEPVHPVQLELLA